jgi:hypothetical protein
MKRCAAERACVDRREQEARERLRNNPVKTKSK